MKHRITNREKFAVNLGVSALSYLRSVVVFLSIIAFAERAWLAFFLSWGVFALTTRLLGKTLDYPSDETVKELNGLLNEMLDERREHKDG